MSNNREKKTVVGIDCKDWHMWHAFLWNALELRDQLIHSLKIPSKLSWCSVFCFQEDAWASFQHSKPCWKCWWILHHHLSLHRWDATVGRPTWPKELPSFLYQQHLNKVLIIFNLQNVFYRNLRKSNMFLISESFGFGVKITPRSTLRFVRLYVDMWSCWMANRPEMFATMFRGFVGDWDF